jgi:hypothetical protein
MCERPLPLERRWVRLPVRVTSLRATKRSPSAGDWRETAPTRRLASAPRRLTLDEPARSVDMPVSTNSDKGTIYAMQGFSRGASLSGYLSDCVCRAGDSTCG